MFKEERDKPVSPRKGALNRRIKQTQIPNNDNNTTDEENFPSSRPSKHKRNTVVNKEPSLNDMSQVQTEEPCPINCPESLLIRKHSMATSIFNKKKLSNSVYNVRRKTIA